MALPHTRACNIEDFSDPELAGWARRLLPHEQERFGAGWPASHPYRKDWEVAMAVRALAAAGVLWRGAELIGIGAGGEPTLFWLTTRVGRVVATDLYEEPESAAMLRNPGRFWPGSWEPERLVVEQMDARELEYPDAAFDAAFSSSSFEHFGDPTEVRRAVEEACRVVRPGGVLAISTEMRFAGEPPGIPGTLLFSEEELLATFLEGLPLEPFGPVDLSVSPATEATVWPLVRFAADVEAHLAEHGELHFHELRWSRYPHVVLEHEGRRWTSAHLALRRM